MSDILGALEVHFSSFLPLVKALDMDADSLGHGAAGWPSPTSITGNNASDPTVSSEPSPSSFGLSTGTSGFPVTQGVYYDPAPPMTSTWSYPSGFLSHQSVEPLPIQQQQQQSQQHHHHMDSEQRVGFGVDEELEADARMLREVLQVAAPPAPTDAGGLQLLFVPPAEPSREQQQHPLIPRMTPMFSSNAHLFPTFPLPVTSPTVDKTDDVSAQLLLSSLSLAMAPSSSLSSTPKPTGVSFGSMLKSEDQSAIGTPPLSAASSPTLQQQVLAAATHAPATTPTVSYATGVPTIALATEASALSKRKRSSSVRVCKVEGCTKGIRSRGLCKAHGGGRRCTTPGCSTSDQGGGHCVLHGGGRRCSVEGCTKSAQWRGVCKMHGGARRCRYGNCTKNGQVKQGYCRMHHNLVTLQRQQQEQQQQQQQQQATRDQM